MTLRQDNAVSIVQAAVASPAAMAAAGVDITDSDGDGLPDTAAQVAAIYDLAFAEGITTDDGFEAYSADSVTELLWTDGAGTYATLVMVGIPTSPKTRSSSMPAPRLDDAAASLEASAGGARWTSSASRVKPSPSRTAWRRSPTPCSWPFRWRCCSAPAGGVLHALDQVRDRRRHPDPAGRGLGLRVHVVGRLQDQRRHRHHRRHRRRGGHRLLHALHHALPRRVRERAQPFPALRRAGEGTGGALAVSALSSIIGFSVMALAPMPIFVTFGTLTAVMIVFSLLVALLVLPSVLLVVTRSRTGAERQRFIDLTGVTAEEYDPHSRATAIQHHEPVS